jgi:transposase-like protein
VIKDGLNRQGKQRYRCRSMKCPRKTFLLQYQHKGYEVETRRKVIEMALNGNGVRETGRVLKISYNTVTAQLKKPPR